jgi:hypothetical protein
MQCECATYAHKQNLERIKNSVQQESTLISNINLNPSSTTNILLSKKNFFFFENFLF